MKNPRAFQLTGALLTLTLASVPVVRAGSPGPNARQSLLPLGSCQDDPEQACVDDFDCEGPMGEPGLCTTALSDIAIRGILTLIADKDSGPVESIDATSLTEDAAGNTVPVDLSGTSLTLMLEFTRDGETFVIAETYRDLGDFVSPELRIDCAGFCFPTWREPAVETRIALSGTSGDGAGGGGGDGGGSGGGGGDGEQAGASGIRIRWATLPPAANAELIEILGLPEDAVPFLEMVGEVDLFDHSDEADVTASVHRLKVTIRSVLPSAR